MDFLGRIRTRANHRRIAAFVDRAEHRFGCFAQDDLVVANGTGAAVRADINAQLAALGTLMSGASAPGTTYAYMLWADTTNGLLKQRNAANTGWIIRGTLAETFLLAKSSTFNVGVGDFAKTFDCTGTYTVNLVAVATAGDGFEFVLRNSGTGLITLDANSTETINGATTLAIPAGFSARVICNGSLWLVDMSLISPSGTYTATLTNTLNIASSTAYAAQYKREGNVATVSGIVTIDPTATGSVQLGMSVPIASNFGASEQAGGVAMSVASVGLTIYADAANDRVVFEGVVTSAAAQNFWFSFTYLIVP